MATYLVTGGCGFIGSHLTARLAAAGHRVRILDDLSRSTALPGAGAELIQGDVADPAVAARACAGVDGCFHLAARIPRNSGAEDRQGSMSCSITGTAVLLAQARARRLRFVFTSSSRIYGDSAEEPLREDSAIHPVSDYAWDKLAAEMQIKTARGGHRLRAAAVRLFDVYGPGQDPQSIYAEPVSRLLHAFGAGGDGSWEGVMSDRLDLLHVDDAVRMLTLTMARIESMPVVLNACSGRATSLSDLVRSAERAGLPLTWPKPARGQTRWILPGVGSNALLRQSLGAWPPVALSEGLGALHARKPTVAKHADGPAARG